MGHRFGAPVVWSSRQSNSSRTLVALLYHESAERNAEHRVADNLRYFLAHGVKPCDSQLDIHFSIVLSTPRLSVVLPPVRRGLLSVHDLNGSHGYEFTNFKRFLTSTWCDLKAPATRGKKNSGGLCPPGARLVLDPRLYEICGEDVLIVAAKHVLLRTAAGGAAQVAAEKPETDLLVPTA